MLLFLHTYKTYQINNRKSESEMIDESKKKKEKRNHLDNSADSGFNNARTSVVMYSASRFSGRLSSSSLFAFKLERIFK